MNAAEMVNLFLSHRRVTEQVCGLMPEEKYGFTAWEGGFSFGALATHIATSGDFFLSMAEGTPYQRPDPATLPKTPAEIKAYIARKTSEQSERIGRMGDDLDRLVKVRDKQVPLGIFLGQMREHEAHHKGQLMMMARMCGVTDKLFYVAG